MKAVFAHDHWFVATREGYHDKGGLPEEVLQKYVAAFGSLEVICRAQHEPAATLPTISDSRISFAPVENVRSVSGLTHLRSVWRQIKRKVAAADVVIARLPSTLGLIAAHHARKQGTPCLIEVVGHAREANILHGSRLGILAGPAEHFLMQLEIRHARCAVYITEQYLQSVYPCGGESFVCPNVTISSLLMDQVWQRPNGSGRVIGLVGSLDVGYKGHSVALKVLARLEDNLKGVDLKLEFLGRGNSVRLQREAEELGIADKVHFLGGLPPGEAVMHWMDGLDLLLQPSLTEGQGRSIIEAMSRGRPVVASHVGGIPELLDRKVLFAPDNICGLSNACLALLTDEGFAAQQGMRNLHAARRFNTKQVEQTRQAILARIRSSA